MRVAGSADEGRLEMSTVQRFLCRVHIHGPREYGPVIGGGFEGVDYEWIRCCWCGRRW